MINMNIVTRFSGTFNISAAEANSQSLSCRSKTSNIISLTSFYFYTIGSILSNAILGIFQENFHASIVIFGFYTFSGSFWVSGFVEFSDNLLALATDGCWQQTADHHGGPNPGICSLLLSSNMAILSSESLKPKPHNPSMPV